MLRRFTIRVPRANICGARGFAAAAPARTKVVILGSGWGGNRLARKLDKELITSLDKDGLGVDKVDFSDLI